jgi:TRAP-type C4-dicarboxylate transport system permease small subunit
MKKIYAWYEKVLTAGLIIGCLAIFLMAVGVSSDVILRNLELANLPWVVEISEYILYLATFLAAPWVMHKDGHTRVDLVIRLLPPRAGLITQVIADGIVLFICLFLLYYGARTAIEALHLKSLIIKQLIVPEWWLFVIIPISGLLLTIEFVYRIFRRFGWDPANDERDARLQEEH